MTKDAVGARTKLAIAEQTVYGTEAAIVGIGVDITSESIISDIGSFVSGALRSDRAMHKRVRGNFSVGGDINFEQTAEGMMLLYKHALGRVQTLDETDGGIRGQTDADSSANQTDFTLLNVVGGSTFNSQAGGGREVMCIYYDSTGDIQTANVEYSAFTVATAAMTAATGLPAMPKGSWMFLRDTTNYDGIYSHYMEGYRELPVALTVEILRDIAVFKYIGCRVNTLAETFPTNEMLTATVNLLGRQEWSGDWLSADTTVGQTSITLEDASLFPAAGQISVGTEDDIEYTSIATNTVTLGSGLANAHSQYDPVSLSKTPVDYTYPASGVDPFTSFEAAVFLDNVATEVLSANYTLNNNLFADKFQIGSRFRVRAPEQQRSVEGSMNVEFDDMTLYSRFVRGDSARLEIRSVKDLDEIVADQGVFYQKHAIFSNIEFSGSTPTAGGPELITHDMPFVALYDDVLDKPELIIIFVNGQSAVDAAT